MSGREIVVPPPSDGNRLDRFLTEQNPEVSRAVVQRWIESGLVMIDGKVCTKNRQIIASGQNIAWEPPAAPPPLTIDPETFDFPILFEDKEILIIDKPAGLVVHPAPGHTNGTLVNALLSYVPGFVAEMENVDTTAEIPRPGIVHRLDKDTSGCLVVAKTPVVQMRLSKAFAERNVAKTYLAITYRAPASEEGHIENLIGRHAVNRQKMAVVKKNGRNAITDYRVLNRGFFNGVPVALVAVDIHTGRTHQIRVHLASINAPILGDSVYGGRQPALAERQMLHAWTLTVPHPTPQKKLAITAPLPPDFQLVLDQTDWLRPLPDLTNTP